MTQPLVPSIPASAAPASAAPSAASPSGMPGLGASMRRLRLARKLTLQQLAGLAGVSVGMLSQIERDRANPSLRVLCQVRDALGASMGELFADVPAPRSDPAFVCRASHRPQRQFGSIHKELLSQTRPGTLQLMILVLPPHSESGALATPHEKGGMVLEGTAVLTVAGETAALAQGDSFLFDGTAPHTLRNPDDTPARVLWVMAPPRHDRQL